MMRSKGWVVERVLLSSAAVCDVLGCLVVGDAPLLDGRWCRVRSRTYGWGVPRGNGDEGRGTWTAFISLS